MLQRTVEEQQMYLHWHRRRREQVSPRCMLRESDELMYWLEECMVQGLRLVPGWLMPRLTKLVRQADPSLHRELGRERRPEHVIEVLFRAQEVLMRDSITAREPARVIPLFR
jgi:hypothetical protein